MPATPAAAPRLVLAADAWRARSINLGETGQGGRGMIKAVVAVAWDAAACGRAWLVGWRRANPLYNVHNTQMLISVASQLCLQAPPHL